ARRDGHGHAVDGADARRRSEAKRRPEAAEAVLLAEPLRAEQRAVPGRPGLAGTDRLARPGAIGHCGGLPTADGAACRDRREHLGLLGAARLGVRTARVEDAAARAP